MVKPIKCRFVTWQEIVTWTKKLAEKVLESGYKPEVLLAIARSGFVPGRLFSDYTGNPNLICLKVEHWLDTTAQHAEDAVIPHKVPLPIKGKRVLIIDDLVDTGKSAINTINYCKQQGAKETKLAVMLYLTCSQIEPHYYTVKEEDWTWFVFPWNRSEDLRNLLVKLFDGDKSRTLTLKEVQEGFKKYFNLDVTIEELEETVHSAARLGKVAYTDLDHIRLA